MTIFRVFDRVRRQGRRTPQVAFLFNFWYGPYAVRQIYKDVYSKGFYRDLWFMWEGKPLVLFDKAKVPVAETELREFFTYRRPMPDYFYGPQDHDQWAWCEIYPQHAFTSKADPGHVEQVPVSVAQNAVPDPATPGGWTLGCMSQRDENGRMVNRHSITDLEFSDPADLERMGKMGVIAEIYPQIQSIADREGKLAMISEKIGMDRGQYYWNRRKMADSGVLLSCGTDLPLLIDNIPESVYHAVGGYFPEGGEPFNKQNMLTVPELLTAWTRGGAYNLYCEDTLGTLEVGKKADIAVLSGNIFTVAVEDARSLNCELTLLGGKIVHNTL
jgi:hypothetical protein